MFGWEMRTRLPELRRKTVELPREEVRDRDWSNELKGKAYADTRRGAMPKSIRIVDTVLLKVEKSNKLSTNFRLTPFKSGSEDWDRGNSQKRRLSENSFVLCIQCPPDEGLFLLDWRQF